MSVLVMKEIIAKNLYYSHTLLTKYTIEYPHFYSYTYRECLDNINRKYLKDALDFEHYCKTVLFPNAVEQYNYDIKDGYPVMVYEGYLAYTLTYNRGNIISLYFDKYEYTGGAHGATLRYSNTWNLKNCSPMALEDFGLNKEKILPQIYLQIEEQIKNGTNQYFDNYKELVSQTFNPNSFYLTDKGLVIYFQQYDIAPYSSGIVEFTISI